MNVQFDDLSWTPWRRLWLSSSVWCLVDAVDYEWIVREGYRWNVGWHAKTPWKLYAKRNVGRERSTVYLHRDILKIADPRDDAFYAAHHGDHENGQSLDNRRANLRWLTPEGNRANTKRRDQIPTLDAIVARLVAGLREKAPAELVALETMPY